MRRIWLHKDNFLYELLAPAIAALATGWPAALSHLASAWESATEPVSAARFQFCRQGIVWMDRYLDEARSGPTWLQKAEIAEIVLRSLRHAESPLQFYAMHAWVIMSNHVHLLATPRVPPARFLQSVKGFTAREANRILQRTGEPFWQAESYDHWVRDDQEFQKIQNYIEENPVRAGLAASPEKYQWSSAYGSMVERASGLP